ncbi:MAG: translation initiation factor 2 [Lachnospiraceae bacterium]|nr:translation initiation factor 2 [Lachnospiraceae bacterium]
MKGIHHIIVQNNVVRYEFDIRRNITIIRGDSATGKTQLVSMLESFQQNGISSGIEVRCDTEINVIYSNNWKSEIARLKGCIFFIEEGQAFVASDEFADMVKNSDGYFVIITRQNLDNLPYSTGEIYGIRSAGKYKGMKQTYNEFYRLYGDIASLTDEIKNIYTEDSNAGYDFFAKTCAQDIRCKSAGGKSNIPRLLKDHSEDPVLVIADGAAFGPQMESVMRLIENGQKVLLYLPESFEWLLLSSNILNDRDVNEILRHPHDYIDSESFFSWERFFTNLLIEKTNGSFLAYNKSKLNEAYIQPKIKERILSCLPDIIRKLF